MAEGMEPVSIDEQGYTFTYYSASGGVVVTSRGVVEDAGIIGVGEKSGQQVREYAWRWLNDRECLYARRSH